VSFSIIKSGFEKIFSNQLGSKNARPNDAHCLAASGVGQAKKRVPVTRERPITLHW
jgi:hypothetical protein